MINLLKKWRRAAPPATGPMDAPVQVSQGVTGEQQLAFEDKEAHTPVSEVQDDSTDAGSQMEGGLKFSKTTLAFFLMGLLIGLPAMVTGTSSTQMFAGITGVYEVCNSVIAAVASFGTPLVARYISYSNCTWICTIASALTYVICTLPHPLDNATTDSKAGPVIGTMLGGLVYAFGTNVYLAAAAFFPQESVLALSAGSGLSVILGPALDIGISAGFHQDWRRTFLVLLPTAVLLPAVWWGLMDPACRAAAERSRILSLRKSRGTASVDESNWSVRTASVEDIEAKPESIQQGDQQGEPDQTGFGPGRSRMGLLFKKLMPKYVLPLMIVTSSATISLMGTAPTIQELMRFKKAPKGDLQFQLVFLSYGAAQFIFSTLAGIRPIALVWVWTAVQVTLLVIGIIQIFQPFLTYYGVWVVIMFFVGGCVGAGVSNTNYKISEDFRRAGESDEVRSFAMSYSGLGNFGGDAIGGALGVMVETLALRYLKRSGS